VLVDGAPVAACTTFAWQVGRQDAVTHDRGAGARAAALDPVQEAFKAKQRVPVRLLHAGNDPARLRRCLTQNLSPDRATIRDWLSANICRCTGYQMIIEAVEDAARRIAARPKP
jgi:aerobic carbon-monoxide dehydrogenase small subunit